MSLFGRWQSKESPTSFKCLPTPYMCQVCVWHSWRPGDGVGSARTWAIDSCKLYGLPDDYWEWTLGPFEEQHSYAVIPPAFLSFLLPLRLKS